MSVQFLVEDTNGVMYSLYINDDGEIVIFPAASDISDREVNEALEALGLSPEITENIEVEWEEIKGYLHKNQELEDLLESVRAHGTTQRATAAYYPYKSFEYDYEFTPAEFAAYLGTALAEELKKYNGDAFYIARLIAALRNKDGSPLEFDIENGSWTEAQNWTDPTKTWFCINRSVSADGEELFNYCADYENKIWDPIFFQSEVDECSEHGVDDIATSPELPKVLKLFGLKKKEEQLHKEAIKEAPEPEKPAEPDPDGEWGVYYLYKHYEYDSKTAHWTDEWREVVVPYYDFEDAQNAYNLSETIIEDTEQNETYPEHFIVHRASQKWTAEQRYLRKQQTMFESPLMMFEDPALDIWRKWDDEWEEDEEDDDD